ncbi:hypothetical protein RIF29_42211 [Crotalaria pallida]|uniref:Uncharacterized protein n=1 Tax=Crotalaria pallida TaxID=3830 RepID=A0AAN9EC18_CROPI
MAEQSFAERNPLLKLKLRFWFPMNFTIYGKTTPPDSPPPALICCRVDLRNSKEYPRAMRHVKIGDKHYLLGGVFFDPTAPIPQEFLEKVWLPQCSLPGWKEYSRNVYEFDPNNLLTGANANMVLGPTDILQQLSSSSSLAEGKPVRVFNVSGNLYLYHYWDFYKAMFTLTSFANHG